MATSRRSPALSASFRWNQAEALTEQITGFVRERGARSLLDIGAGSGTVALPVSKAVARYVAVEVDAPRADALRAAGLAVIAAAFPVESDERFDAVVSSHSIPEGGVELYRPFLAQAWQLVAPGGFLLIITHKGANDSPVVRLAERLRHRKYAVDDRYTAMLCILRGYGEPVVTTMRSYVETAEISDIAELWGPWFWDDDEQRAAREPLLRTAVETSFGENGRYRIPVDHVVVSMTKRCLKRAAQSGTWT